MLNWLTEEDRAELYTIYHDSFDKGYIPEDWTDSFLRFILKPGKEDHKLNGYRILTRITDVASPLQCLHQTPGRSEPKWTQQDSHNGR